MTDRLADWVALVDELYPERDAGGWDNTGLQVGAPDDPVTRVLVCLDVTDATVREAAEAGADLVLAHHPLFFRPLAGLTPGSAAGQLALRAAREGIGVLAAHSNLDVARGGTTQPIVDLLGLDDARPLAPHDDPAEKTVKLVTFVPVDHTMAVLEAMAGAGAGVIGEYDHCSYRLSGTGTFRPSEAANPASGVRGQLNEEHEERLEMDVPRRLLADVAAALDAAHPYEEVAYDVYPLEGSPNTKGLGRVGDLPETRSLRAVADALAEGLPAPFMRVAGDLDAPVRRVAACGGAGDRLIDSALSAGADVYVTGDLRHHPTLDAVTQGMACIDAGHYASEAAALPSVRADLARAMQRRGLSARLVASEVRTEPWSAYVPPLEVSAAETKGAP